MRTLFKSFLISVVFFVSLLLWWRPAPDLVALKPVNWAQEYKEALESPKGFDAFGFNRAKNAKLTLDEFIAKKTKDRLIEVKSNDLQTWVQEQAADPSFDINKPTYFHLNDPLLPEIGFLYGYIKVFGNGMTSYINVYKAEPDNLGGKNIPTDLRYPSRQKGMIWFGVFVLLLLIMKGQAKGRDLVDRSSAATGMKAFMTGLVAGGVLIYMPFFYGWYHDLPPFVFMGGVIVIFGIIGLSLFGWQVVFAENLIKGKNLLAHWSFTPEEWMNFTEKEYKAEQEDKKGLLIFISIIILFVGAVFWLIMRDEGAAIVFLLLLGLIALLAVLAVLVPWLTYQRNKKHSGEIFIGEEGLYLNGSVHTWTLLGARLENVDEFKEPFHCLAITYSYLVMAGRLLFFFRTNANLRVPIPQGKEEEAAQIVKKLQDKLPKRKRSKK